MKGLKMLACLGVLALAFLFVAAPAEAGHYCHGPAVTTGVSLGYYQQPTVALSVQPSYQQTLAVAPLPVYQAPQVQLLAPPPLLTTAAYSYPGASLVTLPTADYYNSSLLSVPLSNYYYGGHWHHGNGHPGSGTGSGTTSPPPAKSAVKK